jgi:hypothetical protein
MTAWPTFPTVYEINTWAWLDDLGRQSDRPVRLDTVPQAELERLAAYPFDGLWLMGVWERSPRGREIAREHRGLQAEYRQALPDYRPEDVVGSPYAVHQYQVDPALGGDRALALLRERLRALGLRLLLDFVPNHLAVDHPWLQAHPERFVIGSRTDLDRSPGEYFVAHEQVFAHGRDPHFPGWTDTAQLDYRRADTRRAMADLLLSISRQCDGVRCDMAMLVTRDTFLHTWSGAFDPPGAEFWPAAITDIRARAPGFLMLAEVYWDMEWKLQQMGFDYTYDKRLYDRLVHSQPAGVVAHLLADFEYQRHLARFVENHDEARALTAFGQAYSQAAATLVLTLPGLRLVHDGQMEGRRRKLPVQLGRRAAETPVPGLAEFYRRLLAALAEPVMHEGAWGLLPVGPAGEGNEAHRAVVAHCWTLGNEYRLVVTNLSPEPTRCHIHLELPAPEGGNWQLVDRLSELEIQAVEGTDGGGATLSLPGYGYHLFEVRRV